MEISVWNFRNGARDPTNNTRNLLGQTFRAEIFLSFSVEQKKKEERMKKKSTCILISIFSFKWE